VDEGEEVILEDAARLCGCQKDNDSSRQTPTSQFRQLVACVLGATWKVSRVEIEQQKNMLLITSLETTWVASAHRVR